MHRDSQDPLTSRALVALYEILRDMRVILCLTVKTGQKTGVDTGPKPL